MQELVPDGLWERIESLLPEPKPRRHRHPGRRPIGDRAALAGVAFVLKTCIVWSRRPSTCSIDHRMQPCTAGQFWVNLTPIVTEVQTHRPVALYDNWTGGSGIPSSTPPRAAHRRNSRSALLEENWRGGWTLPCSWAQSRRADLRRPQP